MAASRRLQAVLRCVASGEGARDAKDTRKPVALVLGAGAGVGQGVAIKFAQVNSPCPDLCLEIYDQVDAFALVLKAEWCQLAFVEVYHETNCP